MPRSRKLIVNEELIQSYLPEAPEGFSHRVDRTSSTVYRVVLVHPNTYTYKEHVETTWGFVKGPYVYRTSNGKNLTKKVCHLLDAKTLSGYTTIVPVPNCITPD